jgi:hypothetical protein
MTTVPMLNCEFECSSPPACFRLCALLAFALQIQLSVTVTGAHAEEVVEQLYPGRYVATCKPTALFGCVCETDSAGQAPNLPSLINELGVDNSSIRNAEYSRMIEWLRLTCRAVTQSRRLP